MDEPTGGDQASNVQRQSRPEPAPLIEEVQLWHPQLLIVSRCRIRPDLPLRLDEFPGGIAPQRPDCGPLVRDEALCSSRSGGVTGSTPPPMVIERRPATERYCY